MLLGISEITLRIMGFGTPVLYVVDPQIGYYPAPGQAVTRIAGASLQFNSFGMRAPEYVREKPPGFFRVLMLGDSTLYGGSYIDQDDLYARRLEAAVRKDARRKNLQVLNMGVNTWGPFHKLGYISRFGTFGADVAIICLPAGDVYRPLHGLERVPYFSTHAPPHLALEEVFRHLTWRYTMSTVGPYSPEGLRYQAEQGVRAYGELARRLHESGAEVFVEVLPNLEAGYFGQPSVEERQIVAELTASMKPYGIPVHFPVGLFRGQGKQEQLYHDKVHLDVMGHHIYARYLEHQIQSGSSKFKAWMDSPSKADAL